MHARSATSLLQKSRRLSSPTQLSQTDSLRRRMTHSNQPGASSLVSPSRLLMYALDSSLMGRVEDKGRRLTSVFIALMMPRMRDVRVQKLKCHEHLLRATDTLMHCCYFHIQFCFVFLYIIATFSIQAFQNVPHK